MITDTTIRDEKILKAQHKAMTEYRDALWHRIQDLGIDHAYRAELILND